MDYPKGEVTHCIKVYSLFIQFLQSGSRAVAVCFCQPTILLDKVGKWGSVRLECNLSVSAIFLAKDCHFTHVAIL